MEKFTGAKFLKQGDQGICRFKLNNMVAMDKVIVVLFKVIRSRLYDVFGGSL